jgi:hypothetical protein
LIEVRVRVRVSSGFFQWVAELTNRGLSLDNSQRVPAG